MKKTNTIINIIAIACIFVFFIGTLFLWYDVHTNRYIAEDLPEARSYTDFIQPRGDDQKNDEQNNTTSTENQENEEVFQEQPAEESVTAADEDIETTDELPKSLQLAVPFTSQAPEKNWDQPWQDACEEAAVLMLDAYYRGYSLSPLFAKDELLKMVDWEETQGWSGSIEIEKVQMLAEDFVGVGGDKRFRIIENPTVEDIKASIAAGHPVLVVADGKILPNPHFSNGGPVYHALVVKGYTDKYFITNDPGTQFGESFRYTYDELMMSIRDWNDGDVKNGRRVVMTAYGA